MRLTALVLLVSPWIASVDAVGQNRYGGSLPSSASTDDFLKSLEGLSDAPTPGGYRNAADTRPAASAAQPSPPNELRNRSQTSDTRPSVTRPPNDGPTRTAPRPVAQPTRAQPPTPRSPAADPFAPKTRGSATPHSRSTSSPEPSSLSQLTQPGRTRGSVSGSASSSASARSTQPPASRFESPSTATGRVYGQPTRAATTPTPRGGYGSALSDRNARPSSSQLRSRFEETPREREPIDGDPRARERSVLADNSPGPRELRTQQMLEKMLRRHSGSQLSGTPMTLASVIATAPSRVEQSRRVEAYWALTSSVADYYLGLWEADELRKLRNEVSNFSQPLGTAQTKLSTRIDTSLKAARSAQYQLARVMGTDAMPLPSDTPFTGPYATRFESVFSAGAPPEALVLRDLLPLRLAELQDAAGDLAESEDWVERVRNDRAARQSGEGVIKALKLNALTRRAFVQLARDYNLQINRYTQLAAPELVDTGRLVAMLIRTPSGQLRRGEDAFIAGSASDFPASANRDFRSDSPARR